MHHCSGVFPEFCGDSFGPQGPPKVLDDQILGVRSLRRQKSTNRLFHELFPSSRCLSASKVRNDVRHAKAATMSSSCPSTSNVAPTSLLDRKVVKILEVSLSDAFPFRTARADFRSCRKSSEILLDRTNEV